MISRPLKTKENQMTLSQQIISIHSGKKSVTAGEFVESSVDLVLANDITAPLAIEEFLKSGSKKVFDPRRIVLVPDHFTPCKDIRSAEMVKVLRDFSARFGVRFYELGKVGIEHALLPEEGLTRPCDLIVGADSHTCTYGAVGAFSTGMGSTDIASAMITGKVWMKVPSAIRFNYHGKRNRYVGGKDLILYTIGKTGVDGASYMSMEFCGEVISNLPMDDRFTICNMAIEAGAKNGIIGADDITENYMRTVAPEAVSCNLEAAGDSDYWKVVDIDVSGIEPQVAAPHLPSNSGDARKYSGVRIDQAVIGSCTNGRISDLRRAASILNGQTVHPGVRCIVIPATPRIYRQAVKEGLIEVFMSAGCIISPPTCGPCLGGHMGVLAKGETAIATTNRNFIGRMGHVESYVYLSGPEVAAASAVRGRICHPEEIS